MAIQKPSHTFTKIGYIALQATSRHILLLISFLLFAVSLVGQEGPTKKTLEPAKAKDTLSTSIQELVPITRESVIDTVDNDSIQNDSIKKKSILDGKIKYKAKDYVKISQRDKKIYLYNEAELYYLDTELKAGIIVLDYEKNEVYAGRIKDSTGALSQYPYFKQGNDVVEPDSIRFNYDTEKALVWNSRTEQNDFRVFGEMTKKENDSVVFIKNARFTTSDNVEDPEYYFLARRIKLVPKKKIISGFTNMYIADVPTPIGVPFAYFPLTEDRTSGFIFPTFGENNNRGYFFQNGGYYFALSDHFDLALLGDYFTNGSYGLRAETNYAWRYKFRGNISVRFENLINGERGFPGFSKSRIYNIRWSHTQDPKSNPNSRISASVNLGSSQYYQQSVNQLNTPNFLNNTLSSSVSYSRTFPSYPSVNLSVTATHQQNTQTETINMTLPTLQASMERIYPFAKRDGVKRGAIQNINFQYNFRGENRIQTTDSLFFKKEMFDDARVGVRHSIPINTNFKVFNHFSVTMGGTYEENWTLKTIRRNDFDPVLDEATVDTIAGFDSFRQYSFSASVGTTIYGMFPRGEDKKIQAIRHVMRPSISYNINPSFDQYYDEYIIDADGNTAEFTRFENNLFGTPGRTFSSSIGLALNNTLEAKVRNPDTTKTEAKKITIFNNLNFSTSYNIAADSLQWSPVRVSGGTAILDNKMNINFGATLDPYALDNDGNRIDVFNIDNGGSLFRLSSANMNVNYSFSSKNFKGGSSNNDPGFNNTRSGGRNDDLFGRADDFSDSTLLNNEDEEREVDNSTYANKLPWDLRLAYSLTYSNARRQNEITTNSLMFSGNIQLSPKWKVGASSGYDFKNKGFTYTQLRFERDLDSWVMRFNWVPFSARSSWYFFIGIRSSVLSDIKWDKRREPDRRL